MLMPRDLRAVDRHSVHLISTGDLQVLVRFFPLETTNQKRGDMVGFELVDLKVPIFTAGFEPSSVRVSVAQARFRRAL